MPDYKTPGVYIEELPATGPIAGVGTSTAAFLGSTVDGPVNLPTKVTNWTQFKDTFGEDAGSPRLFLPYAVRGFFDNGGTIAYVVRVSTARRSFLELDHRGTGAGKALRVEAKKEGTPGDNITVAVQDAQIVAAANNAKVRKARAAISSAANNVVTLAALADAALFRPGDVVTIEGTAERAAIDRIVGEKIMLSANLTAAYDNTKFVRIADLVAKQKTFRVQNNAGIEAGSIVHIAQTGTGGNNEDIVVDGVSGEFMTVAGAGLAKGYTLAAADADVAVTTSEFNLVLATTGPPAVSESFLNLSMDTRHSRYFARIVNSQIVKVSLPVAPNVEIPPKNLPKVVAATHLASGADDNPGTLGPAQYQTAIDSLETVDDVNLVCVPGRTDATVQGAVLTHCEKMADRFAIFDAPPNLPPFGTGSVITHRAALTSKRGYAALYYPWIRIPDPRSRTGEDTLLIPPSGHMAGIYARSDEQRGVHKAPANEFINGVLDLERPLTNPDQGELNIEGINALRIFPGQRPIVWGARTTTPKDETPWRYVNVRRLFLYVEESIQKGIRWAVFEPNDRGLWKKLERTITEFLTRVWRSGALFGKTADEAFYVKIDDELNPDPVRALGQVVIEIGIAPVRPAEFVIVRIAMWDGGSQASES